MTTTTNITPTQTGQTAATNGVTQKAVAGKGQGLESFLTALMAGLQQQTIGQNAPAQPAQNLPAEQIGQIIQQLLDGTLDTSKLPEGATLQDILSQLGVQLPAAQPAAETDAIIPQILNQIEPGAIPAQPVTTGDENQVGDITEILQNILASLPAQPKAAQQTAATETPVPVPNQTPTQPVVTQNSIIPVIIPLLTQNDAATTEQPSPEVPANVAGQPAAPLSTDTRQELPVSARANAQPQPENAPPSQQARQEAGLVGKIQNVLAAQTEEQVGGQDWRNSLHAQVRQNANGTQNLAAPQPKAVDSLAAQIQNAVQQQVEGGKPSAVQSQQAPTGVLTLDNNASTSDFSNSGEGFSDELSAQISAQLSATSGDKSIQGFSQYLSQARGAAASPASNMVGLQIQKNIANGVDKMTVHLEPAELGRVEIRLKFGKDGSIKAHLLVDKPETLAMLQRDSSSLERALQNSGFDASDKTLSFDLRDGNQNKWQEAFENSRNENGFSGEDKADIQTITASISLYGGYAGPSGVNMLV